MSESYKKLVKTLQTIFEMDKADLDFGIYRIMNQKRDDINDFLENDLLSQVKKSFEDYNSEGRGDLQQELEIAIEQAKKFGALDPETTDPVIEIRKRIDSSVDAVALENDVFSKLHTFFSRYYDKGDFISKRRYKADTYSIPYEGEEVKLYWANYDQYYIKSSEHLRDYAFMVEDDKKSVRIKLIKADTEKDNIKAKSGEERRFVLDKEYPLSEENGELLIHFNFLPIGKKKQEKLNEESIKTVFEQSGFDDWLTLLGQLAPTDKKPKRTLLERHLNEYTARNTFDYFIHKDLAGFLNRELDFFIKNEVLFLDDIDETSFSVTEQQLRKIKIVRSIAKKIIRMLAQLEDFQKKLWLKKKFVIETNYCITLDRIPFDEELYKEIFLNEGQLAEWEKLFSIDRRQLDKDRNSFEWLEFVSLPYVKYLLVDTNFFDIDIKDRLVSLIDNLEMGIDCLLVNSDNVQALDFLNKRYSKKIDCVHIDPPYNTDTSGFLYKNSYEHSSWLSFMQDRIIRSQMLLSEGADFICHIDENEYERLNALFDNSNMHSLGTIIWDKKNPMLGRKGLATQHEYVIWRSNQERIVMGRSQVILSIIEKAASLISQHGGVNDESRRVYKTWLAKQKGFSGGDKAYKYIDDDGSVYRLVAMGAPEKRIKPKYHIPLVHPVTNKECPVPPNGWSRAPETLQELISNSLIIFGKDETTQPQKKVYLRKDAKKQITSVYSDGKSGKAYLDDLGLEFPYCHPVSMYEHLLSSSQECSTFIDFFAGSGTNGHAVINMMRDTGLSHKSILVEMGGHFDAVLKPRLLKVVYSEKWKDGVPIDVDSGISYGIKYIRLESYEDVLNNLILNRPNQDLLSNNKNLKEDYMLGYWLDVETTDSPSLLNIDQFEDPFNYKLNIGTSSVGVTKETVIDLIETFNYLIGLKVKTIDAFKGFKIVIGVNPQDESVLIVWRNTKEKDNNALEEFLDKQGYNPRDSEFDHIYVNGDHTLEDPRSIVKMIEIEFKRLMFDVEGV